MIKLYTAIITGLPLEKLCAWQVFIIVILIIFIIPLALTSVFL